MRSPSRFKPKRWHLLLNRTCKCLTKMHHFSDHHYALAHSALRAPGGQSRALVQQRCFKFQTGGRQRRPRLLNCYHPRFFRRRLAPDEWTWHPQCLCRRARQNLRRTPVLRALKELPPWVPCWCDRIRSARRFAALRLSAHDAGGTLLRRHIDDVAARNPLPKPALYRNVSMDIEHEALPRNG